MSNKKKDNYILDKPQSSDDHPLIVIEQEIMNINHINTCKVNQVPNKDNCRHVVKNLSSSSDVNQVSCFLIIDDIKAFLDENKEYSTEYFGFYISKCEIILNAQVTFIPSDENFSVRVQFSEDEGTLSNASNSNETFSINLDTPSPISFEINCGIYCRAKGIFQKLNKEKLEYSRKSFTYFNENYCDYSTILYEKMANPFIFKITLISSSESPVKCDEFCGISNEGNTCYINSIIQSMYHIGALRKAIYKIPSIEDTPIHAIQKIFYLLQTEKEKGSIKLSNLFKSLEWEKNYWNKQQDSQEIFNYLFDMISEVEKNCFDEHAVLSHLCKGDLVTSIKCIDIDFISEIKETFLFLQLDINASSTVTECIEKYLSVETLQGENKYEHEDKTKHDAVKNVRFEKIPQIFFLHLKRFKCDNEKFIKLHEKVEYPQVIDLSMYYSNKVSDLFYTLYCVIVHDGEMNSGHYFVFIRDFHRNSWVKFNDTKVTIAKDKEVFEDNFGGWVEPVEIEGEIICEEKAKRTAYILIYVQMDKINNIFIDVPPEDIPEALLDTFNVKAKVKSSSSAISTNSQAKPKNKYEPLKQSSKRKTTNNIPDIPAFLIDATIKSLPQKRGKVKNENRFEVVVDNTLYVDIGSKKKNIWNNLETTETNFQNEKNQNSKDQKILTKTTSHHTNDIKSYVKKNKKLLRSFQFQFIKNSLNKCIHTLKIERKLDTKIICLDFIQECHKKLPDEVKKQIDLEGMKLAKLNNIGVFITFLNENDDITEILEEYHDKNLFLCFYLFDLETLLEINSDPTLLVLHILKDGFESSMEELSMHDAEMSPVLPIVIKEESMLENKSKFRECIYRNLETIFQWKEDYIAIKIIETGTDFLLKAGNYRQVKVSSVGEYEILKFVKCKGKLELQVIRLAISSIEKIK